ncbi:hypothetical protein [Paraburkholderia silvatlantica]|uniref:hypothetical protein n=1 Tax=Paraburkholderia silvatlantica TaxID=321895 RepID=UPI0015E8D776|nr:hypothetical protein [Paraburkholderia silvatlantica]
MDGNGRGRSESGGRQECACSSDELSARYQAKAVLMRDRHESVANSNANESHSQQKHKAGSKVVERLHPEVTFHVPAALLCGPGAAAWPMCVCGQAKKAAPGGAANKETEKQS